jgi:hypothetical protein
VLRADPVTGTDTPPYERARVTDGEGTGAVSGLVVVAEGEDLFHPAPPDDDGIRNSIRAYHSRTITGGWNRERDKNEEQ